MPIVPSTTLRLAGLGLGSTEAAWRLVRGSSFRRVAGATTPPPQQPTTHEPGPAQLLLVLHLLSPSSPQHTLLPAIGTVAHPQLPINPGLHTACTEVVCARGGVVSTTLARDSKVTRCLLCNYCTIVASESRKRLRSLSSTPRTRIAFRNIAIPRPGIFIVTSTTPNHIPNLKCCCYEDSWRLADREKSAFRKDGIPTGDRAQRAARARADFDCSP
jgi:hypothetical protein